MHVKINYSIKCHQDTKNKQWNPIPELQQELMYTDRQENKDYPKCTKKKYMHWLIYPMEIHQKINKLIICMHWS